MKYKDIVAPAVQHCSVVISDLKHKLLVPKNLNAKELHSSSEANFKHDGWTLQFCTGGPERARS